MLHPGGHREKEFVARLTYLAGANRMAMKLFPLARKNGVVTFHGVLLEKPGILDADIDLDVLGRQAL